MTDHKIPYISHAKPLFYIGLAGQEGKGWTRSLGSITPVSANYSLIELIPVDHLVNDPAMTTG